MAKNTGLGKGLDALFAKPIIEEEIAEEDFDKIKKIRIIDIEPNVNQPRRKFDIETIEELAESIKMYGVIQPIIVRKKDDYYEIIAGERRWRAAKKAGLMEMPCIVRNEDERKSKEIALIENIQREDLNPIEKARGFKQLIDEYGLKQQELADLMGINRTSVTNCLRILNLDDRVIDLALQGSLTEGHCRTLLGYEDPEEQYQIALRIVDKGQSVREIEEAVKKVKKDQMSSKAKREEKKKYAAIYRDIEDKFQGFFGTKVKLDAGVRSGRIIIKYSNNEELERLLDVINK